MRMATAPLKQRPLELVARAVLPEARGWETINNRSFRRPVKPGMQDRSVDYVVVTLESAGRLKYDRKDLKGTYARLAVGEFTERLHYYEPKRGGFIQIPDYWG